MKKLVGVLAALTLAACGRPPEVDFKDGLPGADATTVDFPSQSGQGLTAAQDGPTAMALGGTSGLWLATWGTTAAVNLSTAFALGTLGAVVSTEPTSLQGDVATWVSRPGPLEPTVWRLTMTRTAPNAFSYVLEGKPRGEDDSTYVSVVSGNHTVAISAENRPMKGYGEGSFLIEWDHATGLNPSSPRKQGSAEFRYARMSPTSEVKVEVDFEERSSTSSTPVTSSYRYAQVPGGEGSFEFAADMNIHGTDTTLGANERGSIKSRWLESGEGRSDVRLTGGDLTGTAELNECWDAQFRSTYLRNSESSAMSYGTEAQGCAIQGASYAQ
jgi:hypothetical protein